MEEVVVVVVVVDKRRATSNKQGLGGVRVGRADRRRRAWGEPEKGDRVCTRREASGRRIGGEAFLV